MITQVIVFIDYAIFSKSKNRKNKNYFASIESLNFHTFSNLRPKDHKESFTKPFGNVKLHLNRISMLFANKKIDVVMSKVVLNV